MKKSIRASAFLLFLTIAFLLVLFCLTHGGEDPHFVEISNALLADTFENDTLSMQFSLKNATEFGLSEETCALPDYDRQSYLSQGESVGETLQALSKINPSHLSLSARKTYEVLVSYLNIQKEGSNFPYFEEPLSSTSGIHISLPVLLAEFPMNDEEDIECYLSVLSRLPSYFDSLASFEADKAARGMFMAAIDADKVISQCDYFSDEKGMNIFKETFLNKVTALFPQDPDLVKSLVAKHDLILQLKVQPAYASLADKIFLLKDSEKSQAGLCQYENGKEYYAYLLRRQIGTDKTPKELSDILCARLEDLYEELSLLSTQAMTTPDLAASQPLSAEACLPALQTQMKNLFPSPGKGNSVVLKSIPSSLEEFTAPAYYFIPAVSICPKGDASLLSNVIYVGKDIKKDPVSLFTTLAHEGYPGHMYQNVYFLSTHGVNKRNILRYCMDFPGYSEGWALYTELLSFSYADGNKSYLEMLRLSKEIQLCLLSVLDIRIHHSSASLSDIKPYLARIGITDPNAANDVYSYLINEPGTYLKYYGGYLELLECKELYRKTCISDGEEYSDLAFHTFFLEHGPDSYVNIRAAIEE